MNIQNELEAKVGISNSIYLNNIEIDPLTIKAIMINEVVPSDALQDFYGLTETYCEYGVNHLSAVCGGSAAIWLETLNRLGSVSYTHLPMSWRVL